MVYRCVARKDSLPARPGKRIAELKWVEAQVAARDTTLAFDHGPLVEQTVDALRLEVGELRFPAQLLEPKFTLFELQAVSEIVLGRPLDKSSFRRRLDAAGCVEPVSGEMRTGPFRPAQLHRLVAHP